MSGPFDPTALAKAVHATLDEAQTTIPDGHSKALLLHGTYSPTAGPYVQAIYVARVGENWHILAEAAYKGTDGPSAGVAVAWSGKLEFMAYVPSCGGAAV